MLNLHTIITFSNFGFGRTHVRTDARTALLTLSLLELLIAAKNLRLICNLFCSTNADVKFFFDQLVPVIICFYGEIM